MARPASLSFDVPAAQIPWALVHHRCIHPFPPQTAPRYISDELYRAVTFARYLLRRDPKAEAHEAIQYMRQNAKALKGMARARSTPPPYRPQVLPKTRKIPRAHRIGARPSRSGPAIGGCAETPF